uniref:Putative LOV domain-containing protein n=1 Tax=Adiantum raddianum TaxID=32168 RepID=A0A126WVN4_ADIRA|nr:putative LOV domain-containing protein [Adiantum raddianum]
MGRPIPAPSSPVIPARLQLQETDSTPITRCVEESMRQSYGVYAQESLQKLRQHSFIVTDPYLPGHPIVYASEGFLRMTGYLAPEVIGRSPRFLQGPGTDRRSILQIRDAVREEKPCHVVLLNYTKQGLPFPIVLHIAPVFSQTTGKLLHYVGAQKPLFEFSSKQMRHCEATLSVLCKGPSVLMGPKILADCIDSCYHLSDSLLNYRCSGQRKKRTKIPSTILQLVTHELATFNKWRNDRALGDRRSCGIAETALCCSLTLAFNRIQQSFVISDCKLPGMPVAYASDMFLHLTGYERHEVIGRSCKFLQGLDTDARVVEQIGNAIKEEGVCTIRVLNYKKDGSPFWNLLHVAPVRDHSAKVVYYVGVQLHMGFPLGVESSQVSRDVSPALAQLGVVGAVKVAVRSLQSNGLRRSLSPREE